MELVNLSPAGLQRFALPQCELSADVDVAGSIERPPLRLETLLLEPDQGRFSMVWRGAVPVDKRVLKVRKVAFALRRLDGAKA